MLNRFILAAGLLLLALPAFADITLVYPVEKTLSSGGSIDFGAIAPGESFELTISNATGYGPDIAWDQALIDLSSLPSGWTAVDSLKPGPTHSVKIIVGSDATEGSHSFKAMLVNASRNVRDESFTGNLVVRNDLHKATITELSKETWVNLPVYFDLTLINDSVSDHLFLVSSSLPGDWMKEEKIIVPKKSVVTRQLQASPLVYGQKRFKLSVDSMLSGKNLKSFDASLTIKPTLRNKFDVGLYGFPFFTPSIAVDYFINALASFFI